jgi:hypothetical protein
MQQLARDNSRQQVSPSDDKSRDDMTQVKCKAYGSELITSLLTGLALLLGSAVAGIAHSAPSTGSVSSSDAPTIKQVDQQAQVIAALQLTEVDWHKGGFNNMMLLDATVLNRGKRDVRDIQVVCDHSSNSETRKIERSSATIYGPFPAGKSKSIHEFDMGVFHDQAKETHCSIVHATLKTKRWGHASR